jgi:hypothetical protein
LGRSWGLLTDLWPVDLLSITRAIDELKSLNDNLGLLALLSGCFILPGLLKEPTLNENPIPFSEILANVLSGLPEGRATDETCLFNGVPVFS